MEEKRLPVSIRLSMLEKKFEANDKILEAILSLLSKKQDNDWMNATTLETDTQTLSYIKLYWLYKEIHQKDFLKYILEQNKEFCMFVKNSRKLKV